MNIFFVRRQKQSFDSAQTFVEIRHIRFKTEIRSVSHRFDDAVGANLHAKIRQSSRKAFHSDVVQMTYRLFEPTLARADGHKQRLIGIVSDYGENLVAKSGRARNYVNVSVCNRLKKNP